MGVCAVAAGKDAAGFGRKLDWLKTLFRVTDGEIGDHVGASASLVCRWRKGQRNLDRIRDECLLSGLAEFFLIRAGQIDMIPGFVDLFGGIDISPDNETARSVLIGFMFDQSPIPGKGKPVPESDDKKMTGGADAPVRRECYHGIDGLLDAFAFLEYNTQGSPMDISVYLSLEHSHIARDKSAYKLWEMLRRLGGGNPVRLVFDNWTYADEAAGTLRMLLPAMQTGCVRLNLIKSMQKFFYSNISFYAAGTGIIVTTDPAGGYGGGVSMLVESPQYLQGMSGVFAKFDKITKPIEKHLNIAARDEALYYGQLFESGGSLKTITDGANLLYMDADAYMVLLKMNGITGSQRAYRLERFVNDKKRFGQFLESGRATEVFGLPVFDRMISLQEIKTPDFSFKPGKIKTDKAILRSMFEGMLDCLERYDNLSIVLNRSGLPQEGFSCRLKGDSFVLLHTYGDGTPHAVWSDTWLLVYEYIRQFEEVMLDTDMIATKDAVKAALKIRIENLG